MQDVVLEFAVKVGEEASLFAAYFQSFVDRTLIDSLGDPDAPLVILRSLPLDGHEMKEMVFQSARDAQAFAQGWLALVTPGG